MPALDNERHERFCRGIVEGKCATDAYMAAGYKAKSPGGSERTNASRLLSNAHIKARIAELRAKMTEKTEITLADLVKKAEYLYDAAAKAGQFSASVSALKELGVLTGQRIERREAGGPGEFERMSDEQLRDLISSGINPSGESDEGALDPRVTPKMREKPH